jgi:predicted RNA methylase
VNTRDAVALIRDAIPQRGGTWADLGAGEGTFTRALVELLGSDSRIYAVDRDASAVAAIATPAITATRPSRFSGTLYAAAAERLDT